MRKKTNSAKIVPYVILFIVLCALIGSVLIGNNSINELNYNDFMTKLQNQKVESLVITPKSDESVYYFTGKLDLIRTYFAKTIIRKMKVIK